MPDSPRTSAAPDWERIAREAVLHVIRHREDFHNASDRPCGTCDRRAAWQTFMQQDSGNFSSDPEPALTRG